LVHVEVSQDGEMIFAGVYKGMTALLAWDMKGISSKSIKNGTFIHAVRCHRHTNARLKGFGASTLVENDAASTKTEYRLLCGLGIKNINIWSVTFDKDRSDSELVQPEWECIFMGVTNGTSVELVAFRNGGREAISKSSGQKLRLWDITDIDDVTHKEVENTHDSMSICGNFAYGGIDQLSVVDLDAGEEAFNRTEMILPTASAYQDNGQRRRRAMRTIKKISSTSCSGRIDVAVVCSDGEILLHRQRRHGRKNSADSKDTDETTEGLIPLATKVFDDDDDDDDDDDKELVSSGRGSTPRGGGGRYWSFLLRSLLLY
jgi:hypothetical protein